MSDKPIPCKQCPLFTSIEKIIPGNQDQIIAFQQIQLDALREQLRDKGVKRVIFTRDQKKRLARAAKPIIDLLRKIKISIVKPDTLIKWNNKMKAKKWDYSDKRKGALTFTDDTKTLVIKLATENSSWGYLRIHGELKKLGHRISVTSVRKILHQAAIPTAPQRKGMSPTWKQFLQGHKDAIWACDYFTEEVWSTVGLLTCYVLFFIHHATRTVYIAGATTNPNAVWVAQQARNFSMYLDDKQMANFRFIIHDRDPALAAIDRVLKCQGVEPVLTPPHAPQCNAYAERFVREARETLDNMIIIGQRHLMHVCKKIEHHHNLRRPHQGIDNCIPAGFVYPNEPIPPDKVQCEESLGGLLNHYYAKAA